jgi:hypothetical protein
MSASFSNYFRHYLPPDSQMIKNAVSSGLIIFDTNIFLNAYRFAPTARKQLLSVLALVSDRTWIPHRVAEEFHKNRIVVMADYDAAYVAVAEPLKAMQRKLETDITPVIKQLANRAALTHEERDRLLKLVASCTKPAMSAVESLRQAHGLDNVHRSDPVLSAYQELYDDKVGPPFTDEEHEDAIKEAQRRIDNGIPPGYRDSKKEEPFGDYFIWRQTLIEVAKRKAPLLLFVTADTKEDWYQQVKGRTICARPELTKEIMNYANANLVMLTLSSFFFHAREHLNVEISAETIRQSEQAAYIALVTARDRIRERISQVQSGIDNINHDLGASEKAIANLRAVLRTGEFQDSHVALVDTQDIRDRLEVERARQLTIERTLAAHQEMLAQLVTQEKDITSKIPKALPTSL